VTCNLSPRDRRATEIKLTPAGRAANVDAAPGHVALVRRLFFECLPQELLSPLREALEAIYSHIVEHGTLPAPGAGR
ncbi:MAG: MarR family winged helix-turn-helix transcriptional regulator, partial [Acidimicrobiales bacterium]